MQSSKDNHVLIIFSIVMIAILSFYPASAQNYTFKNKSLDLRPEIKSMGLTIRNQEPRGTCTLFSTTFLVEYYMAKKTGEKNLNLSEEYLNAVTNRAINRLKDGSYYSEALIGYGQFGMVSETESPYKNNFDSLYLQGADAATLALLEKGKKSRFLKGEITVSPNAASGKPGLTDEQFTKLLSHLDSGVPLCIGYAANESDGKFITLANGIKAFTSANLQTAGAYAHSVPLVGYKVDLNMPGGGYVIFRNSGGINWSVGVFGDEGYGYMTFDFLKNFTFDFLLMSDLTSLTGLPNINRNELEKHFFSIRNVLNEQTATMNHINLPYLKKGGFLKINERGK